jgi:uncharacterized HhH-GPD family protein
MVCLAQNPDADRLLTEDPLALLIGMVLDQQIPLEWAFTGPLTLMQRLGRPLDVAELAAFDPDELAALFAVPPAIHRFPKSMAGRVQQLCRTIVADYHGSPEAIWTEATNGRDLVNRIAALPGFGAAKSRIFTALLGKQLGVRPDGWREAAGDVAADGTRMSVADIVDPASLLEVREYKKQMKTRAKAAAAH